MKYDWVVGDKLVCLQETNWANVVTGEIVKGPKYGEYVTLSVIYAYDALNIDIVIKLAEYGNQPYVAKLFDRAPGPGGRETDISVFQKLLDTKPIKSPVRELEEV